MNIAARLPLTGRTCIIKTVSCKKTAVFQQPVNLWDPTGLFWWAAVDWGLTIADAKATWDTWNDPNASLGDKALSGVLTLGGAILPAGGAAVGCRAARGTPQMPAPRVRGNPNTAPTYENILVDSKGNAIPLKPGEYVTGSPDGRFIQVRNASGNPTGLRIDGPHKPASHPDPRAQVPHAHVLGVTNPDGTPCLPVNQ